MTNFFSRAEVRLERALKEKEKAKIQCSSHKAVRPHVTRAFTIQRQPTIAKDIRRHLNPYEAHKSIITEMSLESGSSGSRGGVPDSITEESSFEGEEMKIPRSSVRDARRRSVMLMQDLTFRPPHNEKVLSLEHTTEEGKDTVPKTLDTPTNSDPKPQNPSIQHITTSKSIHSQNTF